MSLAIVWDVASIGSLATTSSGTTPSRALADRYYRGGAIPWVKTMDLANTKIYETSERVTDQALRETSLTVYPVGTVLVAMYGGFQQIGRTGLLCVPAAVNQAITAIQVDTARLVPEYLLAALNYRVGYWKSVASSSRKDPNITGNDVRAFPVALPPPREQRAIAEALSDVDALLAELDRLIAKKRDLKQAAMQQLLTGQIRSPGFHGDWEKRTLEASAHCLDHVRVPLNESQRAAMKGDYPYCGANGVLDYVDGYVIDDDIILMAEDGGYFDEYETRPIAYRMSGKCWVNNHAHVLKAKPDVEQGFLYYSLVHKNILPFLASGTRAKLNRSEMNKIELLCPRDKEEQSAIATVLSDMDAELSALEARRAKTLDLKQAMMQELLTGRIRLI